MQYFDHFHYKQNLSSWHTKYYSKNTHKTKFLLKKRQYYE